MKRTLLSLLLPLVAVLPLQAQDKFNFVCHGFVNPVIWADSRQVVSGREGMMLFYPASSTDNPNAENPDLNMLAITARVNLAFSGPEVLGAKMLGFIEGDFTGPTNATINTLRLRHAYLQMDWGRHKVLAGQYWYPMVVPEIMPMTQPLNMGAPFHPYARYNQLRYTFKEGAFEAFTAALFQLDNKSQGPDGTSTAYLRGSMVPEMHLQLRFKGDRLFFGGAANLLVIKPRKDEDQLYSSCSFSLFGSYRMDGITIKAQTLLSDNLYEGCTMGGYVEHLVDGQYSYEPFSWTTAWLDISRNQGTWRPALFLGYGWNNNFGMELGEDDQAYGRGFDIQSLWRVQPRITYLAGHGLSFMFDVECTHAQYADNAPTNFRVILGAQYDF